MEFRLPVSCFEDREIILDYLGAPSVIPRVLTSGRRNWKRDPERWQPERAVAQYRRLGR